MNFVKEQNPDICVWCEAASVCYSHTADVFATNDEKYLPYNWDSLAERYGHRFVYVGGWRDGNPQAVTSRFPIRNVKRILGNPDDVIVCHGAAWLQIEIQAKTLNIVTLHTWPYPYTYQAENQQESEAEGGGHKYRAKEVEFICNATINSVSSADNEYWMMMGDFNSRSRADEAHYNLASDSPAYLVHDYIKNNTPYIDVIHKWYSGQFIPTCINGSRIDFVYATPLMYNCIKDARTLKNEGWIEMKRDPQKLSNFYHPSDHLPILVEFNID